MTTSYESFVEASLPDLLRFGHVLTGDADRARRLVRSALVGVRWRRVLSAPDPTAAARQAMAREYARWPDEPGVVDSPSGVADALAALPPRQRAVTVLTYGEELSDRDAARALGVEIGTAKSDAAAALSRMRALYPDHERPDATELGRRLRAFLSSARPDVTAGDLTAADVTRAALQKSRWRTALVAAAVVAAAAVAVGGLVVLNRAGDDDAAAGGSSGSTPTDADPSPTSVGGLGQIDVSGLTEVTPDDFVDGLAIGMTVADVQALFGDEAVFHERVSGTYCELQVSIGDELRGWFEPWPFPDEGAEPDPGAELILTEVAYYGKDAKTVAGVAAGMSLEDAAALAGGMVVPTPLGDGVHTVYQGMNAWGIVGGIGYRVLPLRCGTGIALGRIVE